MQPEILTLAEFKMRLSDESARRVLGLTLTDAEALRVIVDDQQVTELYVQWRTGDQRRAAPTPEGHSHDPQPRLPAYKRPLTWVLAGAGVVLLLVIGVVGFNALGEQIRKQQFAETLRNDTRVSENLRSLEGDSLDANFDVNCGKVRDGWSVSDELAAATRNWEAVKGSSNVSQEQWMTNNLAVFEAAMQVCG